MRMLQMSGCKFATGIRIIPMFYSIRLQNSVPTFAVILMAKVKNIACYTFAITVFIKLFVPYVHRFRFFRLPNLFDGLCT